MSIVLPKPPMNKEDSNNMLKRHGWTVTEAHPFSIRHEDGSIATNTAAFMVFKELAKIDHEYRAREMKLLRERLSELEAK